MSLFQPRRYSASYSEDADDYYGNDNNAGGGPTTTIHPMDEVIYLDADSKELSSAASAAPPYLKVTPRNHNSDDHGGGIINNDGSSSIHSSSISGTGAGGGAGGATPNKNGNKNGNGNEEEAEADAAAGLVNPNMAPITRVSGLLQRVSSSLSIGGGGGGGGGGDHQTNSNSVANANANSKNTQQGGGGGIDSSSSSTAITTTIGDGGIDISMSIMNRYHRNYYYQNHNQHYSMNHPERPIGNTYGISLPNSLPLIPSWRLRDRMKTVGIGLIMALNVGTDPPDIIKPYPCAKLQCWMDPLTGISRAKAKEKIGDRLEKQYSKWQQSQRSSSTSNTSNTSTSNTTSSGGSTNSNSTAQQQQQQQSQSQSHSNKNSFKYRKALDPTVEDVRGLCLWLRKQARTERILLHYNGHGVPRPTPNGEIWVFDKNHTEYIPLSVSDLRQWVGKPTIVILDCSSAGILIPFLTAPQTETPSHSPIISSINNNTTNNNNNNTNNAASLRGSGISSASVGGNLSNLGSAMSSSSISANGGGPGGGGGGIRISSGADQLKLMQQAAHTSQQQQTNSNSASNNALDDDDPIITNMDTAASYWVKDTIVLCPTSDGEWLPMNPEYPADIFTSCLTTPIPIALRWFIRQNSISMSNLQIDPDFNVDSIPGQPNDRKTPLGELNWIFTSVTDSIAWNGT
jgi:hypothetical protein